MRRDSIRAALALLKIGPGTVAVPTTKLNSISGSGFFFFIGAALLLMKIGSGTFDADEDTSGEPSFLPMTLNSI